MTEFTELFKINYLKKIYELSLDEIFAEDEDFQIAKAQFDTYFEEKIQPELLAMDGQLTVNKAGVILDNATYFSYSDLTPEHLVSLDYEKTIRQIYSIPDQFYIEEKHPSHINYDCAETTTDFYVVMDNLFAYYKDKEINENEILR